MSPTAHDSFVTIFGVIGVGHLALAWLTWKTAARRWNRNHLPAAATYGRETAEAKYQRGGGPFENGRDRLRFNAQVGIGAFFVLFAVMGGLGAY